MKLHHFREVVAIAEHGSIRAAARHLEIGQPTLTRSLAELENELGAPLFERRARGVVTTELGENFVRRAVSILEEVRRACEEVDQKRGSTAGSVTVGLSIAAHIAFVPSILRRFQKRYPHVRLHLIEGFYPTLESGLREGTVNFYVGPDPGREVAAGLSLHRLFANSRTVLCRVGHPLVGARSLRDLVEASWVTTSITIDAEDEIGVLFKQHGLPAPKLALRSQSALTLMTCLAYSDLLAMAPAQWGEFALTRRALTAIRVREELAAPPIVIIRRTDLPLTPAATHLLDLVQEVRPDAHGLKP